MKVLVDSTVWIDYLKNVKNRQTDLLEKLILAREDICLCGFVMAEVLQGIRDEKEYLKVKRIFDNLLFLETDRTTFELGATIYRELRKQGLTIRNTIDCLIAATVVQQGVHLLEKDRDYEYIDQHYPLNRL